MWWVGPKGAAAQEVSIASSPGCAAVFGCHAQGHASRMGRPVASQALAACWLCPPCGVLRGGWRGRPGRAHVVPRGALGGRVQPEPAALRHQGPAHQLRVPLLPQLRAAGRAGPHLCGHRAVRLPWLVGAHRRARARPPSSPRRATLTPHQPLAWVGNDLYCAPLHCFS